MKKSELRRIIREELTMAEKDAKAAKKIRKDLRKVFEEINDAVNLIVTNLSSLNEPGLTTAFLEAIKAGIIKHDHDYERARSYNILDKYYRGR